MQRKYILTGGPGSGKSSIILALEMSGEYVVREAAEDYIRLRQSQGVEEPWLEKNFQEKILELQLKREDKIPREAKKVFLDRGIADGLAYAAQGSEIATKIERSMRRYDKVFLIENLGETKKTEVRREDHDQALKLEKRLEEVYTNFNYKVTRIQAAPVTERVKQILKNL